MTKKNGSTRHPNLLIKSDPYTAKLCWEVEQKFVELLNSWQRMRGEELVPPPSLNQDMLRWRQMRFRHKLGDGRHTALERESLGQVARWTLVMVAELRNQPISDWTMEPAK